MKAFTILSVLALVSTGLCACGQELPEDWCPQTSAHAALADTGARTLVGEPKDECVVPAHLLAK